MSIIAVLILFWASMGTSSWAGTDPSLTDQLGIIRTRVSNLEQGIIDASRSQNGAKSQIQKIQKLLALQKIERKLGERRKAELEKTVIELESRQITLKNKMGHQKKSIRKFLIALKASGEMSDKGGGAESLDSAELLSKQEKLEAPHRKVLANLVDHSLKEIEMMKADLQDAGQLEVRIQEEKQQLAYLFQDLREQEGVLALNRQLQLDLIKRKRHEKVFQLENYRKLKTAEAQVEKLIGAFNARKELQRVEETERVVSKAMMQGDFFKLKGRLPLPVTGGKVISRFGRAFDPSSGLNIFKKGIDIRVPGRQSVHAVSAGKIAFSGTMPNYGNVVIIDHGEHFYSLCAHLGEIRKKTNESVAGREEIARTDDSGTPLYFEIRARNVAVNPLQWVFN